MGRRSIAIIGEGLTEWFYVQGIRIAKKYRFTLDPKLPKHSDIYTIVASAESLVKKQYDRVVCLVDMDRLLRSPSELAFYKRKKRALSASRLGKKDYPATEVIFLESSPCTEFWFLLHFMGNFSERHYESYDELLPELQRYIPNYEKSRKFFIRMDIYTLLTQRGSLDSATQIAKRLCRDVSDNIGRGVCYSELYRLFEILSELEEGVSAER